MAVDRSEQNAPAGPETPTLPAVRVAAAIQAARPPVLLLGVGNLLMRDDGIGLHVIDALRRRGLPAGVEAQDGGTAGVDLFDTIAGRRRLLVVDAMDSDERPGAIRILGREDLERPGEGIRSAHGLDLRAALDLAALLGEEPEEVTIVGIQASRIEPGLDLSPELGAELETVMEVVAGELGRAAREVGPPSGEATHP